MGRETWELFIGEGERLCVKVRKCPLWNPGDNNTTRTGLTVFCLRCDDLMGLLMNVTNLPIPVFCCS